MTVVPLTALTGLSATVLPNTTDSGGVHGNVDVVADSATGAVYGAHCGWTVDDPSVVMQSRVDHHARVSCEVDDASSCSNQPGTFSATCAIGAVSTTVTLHR